MSSLEKVVAAIARNTTFTQHNKDDADLVQKWLEQGEKPTDSEKPADSGKSTDSGKPASPVSTPTKGK